MAEDEVPESQQEPEEEDEEVDHVAEEGVEVQEHLRDSIEGSYRLKRLLSRDEDGPEGKKKKIHVFGPEETKLVEETLKKWGMQNDSVVKHVLEQLPMNELQELKKTNYRPDANNEWRSACEMLSKYVNEMRERKLVDGGPADSIKAFIQRWKEAIGDDAKPAAWGQPGFGQPSKASKMLQEVTHKNLRYIIDNFDGTQTLEEVLESAEMSVIEDEEVTVNAYPDGPGLGTISRFNRLELIDPLADAAVFGDANLTFSLKLAKHRKALGHVGRVIATTFEELDTLRERYKEIDESIAELEEHYAEVYHGVDCTKIATNPQFDGLAGALGAVYYNFPHSGAIGGFFDGHPVVNWRHENLMRLFFRALRSFVKDGGIVKVSSNQSATGVRYSYIVGSAIENEFEHIETMPFLEWHLHRYGRSYGDKRDVYKRPDAKNNSSYNAQAENKDMVYCFRFKPTGETLPPQTVRLPPTLKTLMACNDGPFKGLTGQARKTMATNMHKRFVTEVSGTHVG